jgi:hypothetical protein
LTGLLSHPLCFGLQRETQRPGFGPPAFQEGFQLGFALRPSGSEGGKLHALSRAVAVGAGRFLDGLPPLGKCLLYVAGNLRHPEAVRLPVQAIAPALQLVRELVSVDCPDFLLRGVERPADDATPASILARREVENETVDVKLRVGFPAGVVVELRR